MDYIALVRNNEIIGVVSLPVLDDDIIMVQTTELVYKNYNKYGKDYYIYKDGYIVKNPNWEEIQKEKEKERISHLKCTKRVLVLLLQEYGKDYYNDILPLIEANKQAKLEWDLCVELERSNPLLDSIGQQLGITPEEIDNLFKYANGEIGSLGGDTDGE